MSDLASVSAEANPPASSALPGAWDEMWGALGASPSLSLRRIKHGMAALARQVDHVDRAPTFGLLVGSEQLRKAPVHRWFTYKEGYSPRLLGAVIDTLRLSGPLNVADVFGGVATTGLAGRVHPEVAEIRSVEYSPWARFAGATKLAWPHVDPRSLQGLVREAIAYPRNRDIAFPDLSSFENPRIFHRETVVSLLSAREHIRGLSGASLLERDFLLLGLGAVIEDLSFAMKDGRALRIRRERTRRPSSLANHDRPLMRVPGRVRQALMAQWTAMLEDLTALEGARAAAAATPAVHLRGDARALEPLVMPDEGGSAFPNGWANLSCFSPPYLNCIDYTELYKLELWLLEHIQSQAAFREVRLGTLRSHPSVRFPPRDSFAGVESEEVIKLVVEVSEWLTANGARRDVGPVVRTYFEDMLDVWRAQHALLATGGVAACVVANSTFSRRDRAPDASLQERWRLPLLTDVLLAHLALLAGFDRVEIWNARTLRPRNVRRGAARESIVVAYR